MVSWFCSFVGVAYMQFACPRDVCSAARHIVYSIDTEKDEKDRRIGASLGESVGVGKIGSRASTGDGNQGRR